MKILKLLALTLCLVLLFSKAQCEDTLSNDYNPGEEEEYDYSSLLQHVTETYLQDENKIWNEKEAFRPTQKVRIETNKNIL